MQVSGAAYCVGNLHLAGRARLGRPATHDPRHPENLAAPLDILIQASNGASDYGNCFGEPLIYGFVRTFGGQAPGGYRSWFKPIMYSDGAGQLDDAHVGKSPPEPGMLVVQLGGPAYRIGLGGGAASSLMSGENEASLDFDSVQRGDPEMEQRPAACCAPASSWATPTRSCRPTTSVPAATQRAARDRLPGRRPHRPARDPGRRRQPVGAGDLGQRFARNATRSWCARRPGPARGHRRPGEGPVAVVGEVTGDGRLCCMTRGRQHPGRPAAGAGTGDVAPKDLEVAGGPRSSPRRSASTGSRPGRHWTRVLRLPSVASKSYLTRKVDRCVTGHVAQQQCVGPNQLPLSDYAVYAQSLFGVTGVALSLGEQPVKGLVDPGRHGQDGGRRGAAEPGRRPDHPAGRRPLLGELDVGGQAARRGRHGSGRPRWR